MPNLVLTGEIEDVFYIGDNVTVKIVAVEMGRRVRLRFSAPAEVEIDRERVRLKKEWNKERG